MLGGRLDRIQKLHAMGVRLITLTWNGANELGCGCGKRCAGGLTPLGKEAVREMERTGVAVDVSHLSRRGFRDVAGIARAPFLASHSNCNAVYRHPRSLTDRQIDCIITRGGLIGINLYRAFLGRPGSAGFAAAHRHIRHVLERGGEHVLALGSDFDGCELEPCFAGVEKLEAFQDYLLANGMPQEQADALFYKNAEKFFSNPFTAANRYVKIKLSIADLINGMNQRKICVKVKGFEMMLYTSTRNKAVHVSSAQAIAQGISAEGGSVCSGGDPKAFDGADCRACSA